MWFKLEHLKNSISWNGFLKSLFRVAYIIGFKRLLMYPSHRKSALTASGIVSSLTKGLINASTKNGSQHIMNADMIIPRVVDALRSLASWNLNFFWCGEWVGCKRSFAKWLLWAKLDNDDRIRLVLNLLLLSEDCLRLFSFGGCLISGTGPICEFGRLIVWIGFVGVFGACCNIGHWDSLDFLCPVKHLPIELSVLSMLHCNKYCNLI